MTEKEYLYQLVHVPGMGPVTIFKLREYFGSFREIWLSGERALQNTGLLPPARLCALLEARNRETAVRAEYEALARNGIRFLACFEEEYPRRLLPFRDRPAGLFVKGRVPDDALPSAAIVGARRCTEYGKEMAENLGSELSGAGVQIISGLALGVDEAAHRGALNAGQDTYAVLGCGINICYPRENYGLFAQMENRGGILTEFVPGTSPVRPNFPMRNRIISGLSDVVIVVEAREKSGSLITAELALEQGKEVFAVPGRATDPLSGGCNRLLEDGAALCLGPEAVLDFLGIRYEKKLTLHKNSEKRLAKTENMVYSFIDSRPRHLEEILQSCGLSVAETMECLLKLELMGLIRGEGNQYYCRKL